MMVEGCQSDESFEVQHSLVLSERRKRVASSEQACPNCYRCYSIPRYQVITKILKVSVDELVDTVSK